MRPYRSTIWVYALALPCFSLGAHLGCAQKTMQTDTPSQALPQAIAHALPPVPTKLRAQAGKPLLVFIHGSPGSGADFNSYLADSALASHYQLMTLDRPGYESKEANSLPNLHRQAAAIATVLQPFANVPICLVGHSYGGPVAVQLALDYPALVQSLVLLAPALDPTLEKEEWQRPIIKSRFGRWLLPKSIQNSNDELMTLQQDLYLQRPRVKQLRVPVVHIHGTWDMFVDVDNLHYTYHYFTGSRHVRQLRLKRVNHFIPWTHFKLIRTELLALEKWLK